MKKYISLLLVVVLMLSITACSQSQSQIADDSGTTLDNLQSTVNWESENAALQEEIDRLQRENEKLQNQLNAYQEAAQEKKEEATVQEADVTVLLVGKSEYYDRYDQPHIEFVFTVTNNTDKAIKGVQGTCIFNDLFGVEIMRIGCDFVGQIIAPGETFTESDLSMECNQFMDDHVKLLNTALDDLIFEYKVKTIVFEDGSTKAAA